MKSLFPELDLSDLSIPDSGCLTARSWCDPSQYQEVVGIDFGCNSVHYYMARCGRRGKITYGDLLSWLLRLPPGTLVLCEAAHLGVPRTSLSLAQPYTADELLDLYRQLRMRGVTLKLAPHAHTGKRMRLWVSHHYPEIMSTEKKTDAADALALAVYVDRCNGMSLANPYTTFVVSQRRKFGRDVTRLSTSVLNAERTGDYRGDLYPQLISLSRKVRRKGSFPSLKFVATIASTLFGEQEGKLLAFTYHGQLPGRRFWMREVLRMSPWHHRGGVARSNLMWHTFRPFLQRHAKKLGINVKSGGAYKKFGLYTDAQTAARTLAMKSFRDMLLHCRDLCIKEAARMGAGQLELSEVLQEVSHGR